MLSPDPFPGRLTLTLGTLTRELPLALGTLAIHRPTLGRPLSGQAHRICPLLGSEPRLFSCPLGPNSSLVPTTLGVEQGALPRPRRLLERALSGAGGALVNVVVVIAPARNVPAVDAALGLCGNRRRERNGYGEARQRQRLEMHRILQSVRWANRLIGRTLGL